MTTFISIIPNITGTFFTKIHTFSSQLGLKGKKFQRSVWSIISLNRTIIGLKGGNEKGYVGWNVLRDTAVNVSVIIIANNFVEEFVSCVLFNLENNLLKFIFF